MIEILLALLISPTAQAAKPAYNQESLILERDHDSVKLSLCRSKAQPLSTRDCLPSALRTNLIPVEYLRNSLRASLLIQTFDKKKPLYDQKREVLEKNRPEDLARITKQNEEIETKLREIELFLSSRRGADVDSKLSAENIQQLKERALWELPRFRRFGRSTNRLNEIVLYRIDKILETPFSVLSVRDGVDQPLIERLKPFLPEPGECLVGACKQVVSLPDGGTWSLYSRKRDPVSGRFFETWRDDRADVVWGDRIDRFYSHYDALGFARKSSESPCVKPEGLASFAGAENRTFVLPTKDDLNTALRNGITTVFKGFNEDRLWVSAARLLITDPAMHFFGYYGTFHIYLDVRYGDYDVRCVARPN